MSKAGLRIYRPGLKMEEEESQGWMSWMWNWGAEPDSETKEVKSTGGGRVEEMVLAHIYLVSYWSPFLPSMYLQTGFDELLTSDEKARLYTAIGYSETATNFIYPKDVSLLPRILQ